MIEAQSKKIKIEDAEADTFKEVLKFIYTGEFPMDLETAPETYLPLIKRW